MLYVAFELSWGTRKLAFSVGPGRPARIRSVPARCIAAVMIEIRQAKVRFGLPENTKVVSCYEAGRDGFWIHRLLDDEGIYSVNIFCPLTF